MPPTFAVRMVRRMLTKDDVDAAAKRVEGHVRRTPVLPPDDPATPIWFKCEWLQHTGSFNTLTQGRET